MASPPKRTGPRDGDRAHDARPPRTSHGDDSRRGSRFDAARGKPARRTRMPLEEIPARHPQRGRGHTVDETFTCGRCKRFVGLLPSGGHHRNHCPYCLYSRHVDEGSSGDRASACKSLMAPIGAFQRPNGEHVLVHRCLGCGFERYNRIGADDDFDLVLLLPVLPPRGPHP
ncbi:MAG: RNHCP domain-containing protein [Ktedonobacterales bacterium]